MSLGRGNHEERPSRLSLNCGRQGDPFSVSGSLGFVQLAAAWLRVDVLLLLPLSALPPRLHPIPGQIRADLSDVPTSSHKQQPRGHLRRQLRARELRLTV